MMEDKTSPAMQFMELVKQYHGHQKGSSWNRINNVKNSALIFAIVHDFEFYKEDFIELNDERWGMYYWGTNIGHMLGEHYYYYACGGKDGDVNMSACLSFEFWKKRKPFILKILNKYDKTKKSQRIAVGTSFIWKGERVTCTSFNEAGDKIIACSYKEEVKYPVKVKKRYAIMHKELQEYNKTVMEELDILKDERGGVNERVN